VKIKQTEKGNTRVTLNVDELEKIVYALMGSRADDQDVFDPLNEHLSKAYGR
jgi:hypothetical protein